MVGWFVAQWVDWWFGRFVRRITDFYVGVSAAFDGVVGLMQDGPQKRSRCCGEENKFCPYQDLNLGPSGRWNTSYTDNANRATKMSP